MLSKILSNGVLSLLDNQWQLDKPWHPICRFVRGCTHQHLPLMISKQKTAERVKTSFWLGKNSKLDSFLFWKLLAFCFHGWIFADMIRFFTNEKHTTSYTVTHLKASELEIHVFSQNEGTFWCCASRKRCQGCLVVPAVCTEHRFAKMSTRRWWAIIPRDFMTWCSLSICGWTPTNGKVMRDPGIPLQVVTVHQFHLLMFTKLDLKSQVSQNPCKFLGDSREDQKKFGVELPFSST